MNPPTPNHHEPLNWVSPHGTVTLLPERGRVLGMTVGRHQALWQPAELTGDWNLGGERLWIGPEADWFWRKTDRVDFDYYSVPTALDPDLWRVLNRGNGVCECELELKLNSHHSDKSLNLLLSRRFSLLVAGRFETAERAISLCQTTSVKILGGTPGQPVDLWSIVQVPIGGIMLMPTVGNPSPRDYFSPCPSGEIQSCAEVFSLRIGGPDLFKVGIGPTQSVGRIAYARRVEGGVLVIERSFPVHRSLGYCDAPLGFQGLNGDAVQFFNDGGDFGSFGEMEHRSPAIYCGQGEQILTETTVTTVSLMSHQEWKKWRDSYAPSLSDDIP